MAQPADRIATPRSLAPLAGAGALGCFVIAVLSNRFLPPQPVSYIPQVMFAGFGLVLSVMAVQLWRRDSGDFE